MKDLQHKTSIILAFASLTLIIGLMSAAFSWGMSPSQRSLGSFMALMIADFTVPALLFLAAYFNDKRNSKALRLVWIALTAFIFYAVYLLATQ